MALGAFAPPKKDPEGLLSEVNPAPDEVVPNPAWPKAGAVGVAAAPKTGVG